MNKLFVRTPGTGQLRVALGSAFLASALAGAPALAQTPGVPAATPEPVQGPQPEATVPSVTAPPPPPAPAPPPPPPPSDFPPISVGVWTRASVAIQGEDPKKLNDAGFDTQFAELNFSGQIHKNVRVGTNINASGLAGTLTVLDAWVGFDFVDEAHLWVGQLLIPVDRTNKAGPFFSIPWNFVTGLFAVDGTVVAVTPSEGSSGRGTGGVLWGDLIGGKLKYFVGAFLDPTTNLAGHPLYSGRVTYSLLGQERGGFGQSACFYGSSETDVVSLSLGAQYKKDGSGPPPPAAGAAPGAADDFAEVNADLLGEFKLGGDAFVNGEIDYYHYSGDNNPAKDQFSVLAAYASPVIGWGQIQPMLRYQFATGDGIAGGDSRTEAAIDAQVGYLIRQQRLRVIANYQYTKLKNQPGAADDITGNKIQLAVQAQFF